MGIMRANSVRYVASTTAATSGGAAGTTFDFGSSSSLAITYIFLPLLCFVTYLILPRGCRRHFCGSYRKRYAHAKEIPRPSQILRDHAMQDARRPNGIDDEEEVMVFTYPEVVVSSALAQLRNPGICVIAYSSKGKPCSVRLILTSTHVMWRKEEEENHSEQKQRQDIRHEITRRARDGANPHALMNVTNTHVQTASTSNVISGGFATSPSSAKKKRKKLSKWHHIALSSIMYVDVGKQTAAFRTIATSKISDRLCFSLQTKDGSLDLQTRTFRQRDAVVSALSMVLEEIHHQNWRKVYQRPSCDDTDTHDYGDSDDMHSSCAEYDLQSVLIDTAHGETSNNDWARQVLLL